MSTAPLAIEARGLGKVYKIHPRIIDMFKENIFRRPYHTKRTVLDDINLDLRRGEIVGILGRNGAGKSTLLKILAGTLSPTTGDLKINGRVTAILELGTGFHPEYTGRENVYMGGLCLGMKKQEIDNKIQSIIEFSELENYIDQPFKTYSSGMQARLTFSTSIAVDPDILIIDEALSVGDARFQMKCSGRIRKLREKNTTILLVSHDINTITTLCDRAIILEKGRIYAEGDTKSVSEAYHKLLFSNESPSTSSNKISALNNGDHHSKNEPNTILRYGTAEGKLLDWGLVNKRNTECRSIKSGDFFRLYMTFELVKNINELNFGFAIKNRLGTVLWGVSNITQNLRVDKTTTGKSLSVTAEGSMWLSNGDYFVSLGFANRNNEEPIDFIENAIGFRVSGPGGIYTTATVNLQTKFKISSNVPQKDNIPAEASHCS